MNAFDVINKYEGRQLYSNNINIIIIKGKMREGFELS